MPNELLKDFAEELKSIREEKSISIQQIAAKTKIDPKFLNAIEEADFEILPELYVRAFIKEYAQTLELNPNEIIAKYDKAKVGLPEKESEPDKQPAPEKEKIESETEVETKQPEEKNETQAEKPDSVEEPKPEPSAELKSPASPKKKLAFLLGGGISIIMAVAVYFVFFNNGHENIIVEKPYEEVLNEQSSRLKEPETVPAKKENMEAADDSLRLFIKAKDTVWLKVTADSSVTNEYLLSPNKSLLVKSLKKYRLVVGNAGGIDLELDDKPLQPIGKPGEVKTLLISRQGIQFLPNNLPSQDEQNNRTPN